MNFLPKNLTKFIVLCIIETELIFYFIQKHKMHLPEQYKNLNPEQKRLIVYNLISQYWNKKVQKMVENFNEDQIEFLFTYFFTESRETRERMWDDMQKKYEIVLKELEQVADRLQKLNLEFSELLVSKQDIEEFGKDRK